VPHSAYDAELPEGRSCVRRQTQRRPYLSVERPGKNDNYPSSFAASDRSDTCIAFQNLSLAFTSGRSDTPLRLQIMTSREQQNPCCWCRSKWFPTASYSPAAIAIKAKGDTVEVAVASLLSGRNWREVDLHKLYPSAVYFGLCGGRSALPYPYPAAPPYWAAPAQISCSIPHSPTIEYLQDSALANENESAL
jgi:hypothetical protein